MVKHQIFNWCEHIIPCIQIPAAQSRYDSIWKTCMHPTRLSIALRFVTANASCVLKHPWRKHPTHFLMLIAPDCDIYLFVVDNRYESAFLLLPSVHSDADRSLYNLSSTEQQKRPGRESEYQVAPSKETHHECRGERRTVSPRHRTGMVCADQTAPDRTPALARYFQAQSPYQAHKQDPTATYPCDFLINVQHCKHTSAVLIVKTFQEFVLTQAMTQGSWCSA